MSFVQKICSTFVGNVNLLIFISLLLLLLLLLL